MEPVMRKSTFKKLHSLNKEPQSCHNLFIQGIDFAEDQARFGVLAMEYMVLENHHRSKKFPPLEESRWLSSPLQSSFLLEYLKAHEKLKF